MNVTAPTRNRATDLAVFVVLSLVPCLMNAFPRLFARAFSEHWDSWTLASKIIMSVVLIAWCLAAVRVGRTWRHASSNGIQSLRRRFDTSWHRIEAVEKFGTRIARLHGAILVGLFYLMWFSARVSLGRWPRWGGADDPAQIAGTSLIYMAICVWLMLAPVAIALPLFRSGAALARDDGTDGAPTRDFVVTVLLLFAALLFLLSDPHHLMTWFLD